MNRPVLLLLPFLLSQTACVLIGGYSSNGGWFVWPGSFVASIVLILVLILLAVFRRS